MIIELKGPSGQKSFSGRSSGRLREGAVFRKESRERMVVDPYRAIAAVVIVVIIGMIIFVVRNRKTWKSRLVKRYE